MNKQNILVVEDEDIMRDALSAWLKDDGFPVTATDNGAQALQILEGQHYDLMIVDLKMPGMDGLTVLREARKKNPDLHVIIITAYPTIQTAVEAMKYGAADYLTKPFKPQDLGVVIDSITTGALPGAELEEKEVGALPESPEWKQHLSNGKRLFRAGKYAPALEAFEAARRMNPAHLETALFLRRTMARLESAPAPAPAKKPAARKAATTEEGEAGQAQCIWMKTGMVSYRLCHSNYECAACEFNQTMLEQRAMMKTEDGAAKVLEGLRDLPASQRKCRYMLNGRVAFRMCSKLYECGHCEYDQLMESLNG